MLLSEIDNKCVYDKDEYLIAISKRAGAMTSADWSADEHVEHVQSDAPCKPNSAAKSAPTSRRGNPDNLSAQLRGDPYSPSEPVPAIPEHFLLLGKRAIVARGLGAERPRKELLEPPKVAQSLVIHVQRPSISDSENNTSGNAFVKSAPASHNTRRKSLPILPAQVNTDTLAQLEGWRTARRKSIDMSRLERGRNEDLFLELANDQAEGDGVRPSSRADRVPSRLSFSNKRRSLPAEGGVPASADRRPQSSGYVFANRPATSRENAASDLQRHMDRYRSTPSRSSYRGDDNISVSTRSRSGRPHRYTTPDEHPPSLLADQVKSPELPQYGRRRPSFGTAPLHAHKIRPSQLSNKLHDAQSESPAESSEPKQSLPDSASVDSQPEDTVWDELDDLKSRIKKLELTGKLPQTSGAAISNETSERPRTATTAPTTIDSSPKHDRPEKAGKKLEVDCPAEQSSDAVQSPAVGGPNLAHTHPNLHSALAKAKSLLNSNLYRTLEATAADALQLAALTGSAGPQGTTYSAAAIINGVTVSDRHVRRKADAMCRNLTDLCLALCEGKHEGPSVVSSPVTLDTPAKSSPTLRYSRSSLGPNDGLSRTNSRPMSRLEARRTSILGSQGGSSLGTSPVASGEELSASEHESTPSQPRIQEPRRYGRAGSRLQVARSQRNDDVSGDEDPTIRPLSRAMTDSGRAKPAGPRDFSTPQRSPSFRDSLVARRANASASYDNQRGLTRVASLTSDSGRRRYLDKSTPPVMEEEGGGDHLLSQPVRRVMSFHQHGSRLSQRRHVAVE